jgi:hypothetical protein
MSCRSCHYPLEHLGEHRCPECGRAFDPRDPNSFDPSAAWQFPRPSHMALFGVLSFAGAFALLTYLDRGHQLRSGAPALKTAASLGIAVCLLTFATISYVLIATWRARRSNPSK